MPPRDTICDRKTDSRTRRVAPRQPLKWKEDAVQVFFVEAAAVVVNHDVDVALDNRPGGYIHANRPALHAKLKRIIDQTFERTSDLAGITNQRWKLRPRETSARFFNCNLEAIGKRLAAGRQALEQGGNRLGLCLQLDGAQSLDELVHGVVALGLVDRHGPRDDRGVVGVVLHRRHGIP